MNRCHALWYFLKPPCKVSLSNEKSRPNWSLLYQKLLFLHQFIFQARCLSILNQFHSEKQRKYIQKTVNNQFYDTFENVLLPLQLDEINRLNQINESLKSKITRRTSFFVQIHKKHKDFLQPSAVCHLVFFLHFYYVH